MPPAFAALTASSLTSALARASSWRISVDKSWVTSPSNSPTEALVTSRPLWLATALARRSGSWGVTAAARAGAAGAGRDHAGGTGGEPPARLQRVAGLALFEPRGGTVDAFGRLLRDLGGHAGLAALGGHLVQFIRHGAELVSGPLLLGRRLVAGVPAGLAGQVTRLARGLRDHLPGLIGGGLGDAAARLARGPADGRGLVPRDGR